MTATADIAASTEALLEARAVREPDYQLENAALRLVAEELSHSPETVLRRLCEQVLVVCGAESAGVSLLEDKETGGNFYWPAIAGLWSAYEGGGMPRSESPCGVVLERNRTLIFHDVEIEFPAAAVASPRITELLLAPFRIDGVPVGTVWALMHSDAKRFDSEDRRLLESLARFAAVAYQTTRANEATHAARAQLSLVNHELAHRLKNMLTMVMAVASQTLKGVTERDAVEAFKDRLQALGSAHDILVDQSWSEAPVRVIAERVIGQLGEAHRIDIAGPDVMFGPRAALSLSLMLHELGTNAIKYGALSVPDGRISFGWEIGGGDEEQLKARWQESGGPEVTPPQQTGFGSRLIGMGLIGRGCVKLSYDPEGLLAEFEAPLRLAREIGREENLGA
ncbi:sensor histidine kinase [Sphingopyxis fribergensis]